MLAVDGVDVELPVGSFSSVLGPSGSGKTTLLRCIAGFERPDTGEIALRGRPLVAPGVLVPAHARGIGVVPQEGALFPHLTVAQNVGFGLTGLRRRARRRRVDEMLALVGLEGLGARRPEQLSGGQQQRVALARALAPEPELILLDEPFSALDAQLRGELREEVRELLRGLGSTALLVTHDQAEALSLSDHLVVMREGRVVASGPPRTVYECPADIEIGRFLDDALVVPGEICRGVEGICVACALGTLPVGRWHGGEGRCRVLIRSDQLAVGAPGEAEGADAPLGTVVAASYFGHDALMRVDVSGVPRSVAVRVPGSQRYRIGDGAVLRVIEPVCTYPDGAPRTNGSADLT